MRSNLNCNSPYNQVMKDIRFYSRRIHFKNCAKQCYLRSEQKLSSFKHAAYESKPSFSPFYTSVEKDEKCNTKYQFFIKANHYI